jgi:hypothetical protein
MIPAALLTLFYLPVHFVLGIKISESFRNPVAQFVTVLTWPVLLPVVLLVGVRPFASGVAGLSGPEPG